MYLHDLDEILRWSEKGGFVPASRNFYIRRSLLSAPFSRLILHAGLVISKMPLFLLRMNAKGLAILTMVLILPSITTPYTTSKKGGTGQDEHN